MINNKWVNKHTGILESMNYSNTTFGQWPTVKILIFTTKNCRK